MTIQRHINKSAAYKSDEQLRELAKHYAAKHFPKAENINVTFYEGEPIVEVFENHIGQLYRFHEAS